MSKPLKGIKTAGILDERAINRWYPMRVTYSREIKVRDELKALGVEAFLPMRFELTRTRGVPKFEYVPAVHNLIFVRSSQLWLSENKRTNKVLASLRYMIRQPLDVRTQPREILWVPDRQMENFIRVASVTDGSVMFLDNPDMGRVGQRVKIRQGMFAGVEGVIKRIKKNKRIVVAIDGCAAVALTTYVPREHLIMLD